MLIERMKVALSENRKFQLRYPDQEDFMKYRQVRRWILGLAH